MDSAGKEVAQGALEKVLENSAVDNFVADGSNANYAAGQTILWTSKKQLFSDVAKWDVGQPNLYQLILLVKDADNNVLEAVPYKIGFRRFEIKDKLMLLNGKRLIINGVNRHEWNPRRGRSITEEDMRKDIEIMKKNNINAVRTCHYPDQSLWYQLCDEAGICLMDETNLESHGSWQKMGQCEPSWNVPGSDSRWEACVVDRATSMLERDKNHPAILWWSCGNESYAGTCILAMSRYFHEKDPSRRVHYEGVFWNRQFEEISDVESRMYASPAEVRAYLENDPGKPYLLCEYMHDMGNSIGGTESYIKLLDEFPMYQEDLSGTISIRPFIIRIKKDRKSWAMAAILWIALQIMRSAETESYLQTVPKNLLCRKSATGTVPHRSVLPWIRRKKPVMRRLSSV